MAITLGTQLQLQTGLPGGIQDGFGFALGLTDSVAIAVFHDDDGDGNKDIKAQLLDVADLVATLNVASKTDIKTAVGLGAGDKARENWGCRLSSTVAFFIYEAKVPSVEWFARTLTNNAGVIELGVELPLTSSGFDPEHIYDNAGAIVVALTSSKALYVYWAYDIGNDNFILRACVFTVSGTGTSALVTFDTPTNVYSSPAGSASQVGGVPTLTGRPDNFDAVALSATTAAVLYLGLGTTDGGNANVSLLSISGTTVTVSDNEALLAGDALASSCMLNRLTDTNFTSFLRDASTSQDYIQYITVSGGALTVGAAVDLSLNVGPRISGVGFQTDLILAYGVTPNVAYEFSLVSGPVPAPTDVEAWGVSRAPTKQTPMVGNATPKCITSAVGATSTISFVRVYKTSLTPTPVAGGDLDPAAMPKPADIDADGGYIYIAALNGSGFPTLIKFSTALNIDGTIVFNPGSGADIGVECSETNGDVVWIAGDFNGNNTVEKTENAGASFAVKDPGTFQPVTAFKVGPLTDEIVLVATESSGSIGLVSIEETRNDGTAWSEKNAGLSAPARIRALDRLDINDAEIVLGNSNAATHRADYSPNTGDDLDDITTGTPASNATVVIVP